MHFKFKSNQCTFSLDNIAKSVLLEKGPVPYPPPNADIFIFDNDTKQLKVYILRKECVDDGNARYEEYNFPKATKRIDDNGTVFFDISAQEGCEYCGVLDNERFNDTVIDTVKDIACHTTSGEGKIYKDEDAMLYDCLVNNTNIGCHPMNPMITPVMRAAIRELAVTVSILKEGFENTVKELIDEKIGDIICR